ncbi:Alpha/Beta hydrolase protein [Chaetomium sp. MPI-SDFR-AT-0129]|nr:Alpha/Beta hydrolase protein [Chaetomium sp. MPI-SDFR-AT-0129]
MKPFTLLFTFLTPLVAASACGHPKWKVGQTVHTTSGSVHGHAASTATEVSEYLGIPYAEPPVNKLRFLPPVRYRGKGRIDGARFGPACIPSNISAYDADFPQSLIGSYGITDIGRAIIKTMTNPGIPISEDCLTLNVWTKPQTGEKQKPVLVFVHGGSFVSGSSAVLAYNGQFFAEQEDVVLVTINYRITFFGFPGNPHSTRNLGLLDQRLAVEWVRDNIARFGGDPKRITLFGESAGGASVDHHTFAFPHDPIIAGVIPMSGTASGITPRPSAAAASLWYNTTSALGCGDATTHPPSLVLSCMQKVPYPSILATLLNTINAPIPMCYSPTIDDLHVFTNPSQHPTAKIPMLIGTTDNESGLFKVFVPPSFVSGDGNPNATSTSPQQNTFWHGENQRTFVCPAAARAARSASEGNPTWRYRWHGVFPNTNLGKKPASGAYHDSETAVLFGNVDQSQVRNTEVEEATGRYLRGAWAAFARDPVRGLEGYRGPKGWRREEERGWPRYVPGEETLVELGLDGVAGRRLVKGSFYDDKC